jgi:NAD+ diphosphatase
VTRFVPGAVAAAPPAPGDICLVVSGRKLRCRPDGTFPRVGELPDGLEHVPLGSLDGDPVWAAAGERDDAGRWRSWPALAGDLDEPLASLAGRALQVITWRRTHQYCGACTTKLDDVPGEHARRCPGCELYVPMQLSPAVLVAIRRGDELLLVRHSYGPTELWALVAGFLEAGESLEQAVHREVREEVGLELGELTYFGSQPWAMSGPGVVLAGFTAECADARAEPVIDGRELTQARWFPLDALPAELPPSYSISRWLIDATLKEGAHVARGRGAVGEHGVVPLPE